VHLEDGGRRPIQALDAFPKSLAKALGVLCQYILQKVLRPRRSFLDRIPEESADHGFVDSE